MTSIRRHLGILLCLAMGGLFLLTGGAVFVAMRYLLYSQFDETLTAKARAIITASEIDDDEFEIDLTVQDFAGFGSGGKDYFEIRRLNGARFLSSPSLDAHPAGLWNSADWPPPPDDEGFIGGGGFTDGRSARFYLQRFYPKDDDEMAHQDLYLVVASPDGAMRTQLAGLSVVLAIAGAAALFLTIPAIRLGLTRGLKPLDRLAAEVVSIDPGNPGRRLDPERYPEELSPVAARLNEWIGRLEASFDRERRFSASAAHELRTPLAELRMMADLGATWPEEATPERCREMLEAIAELEVLLEKLTLLARTQGGGHAVEPAGIDLGKSVDQAVARLETKTAERRISIRRRIAPGGFRADPVLWGTVLNNLLGNAVAHAPEGSEVLVSASPGELVVSNPAPGLGPGDLESMFEPFWRSDRARSDHRHAGLGLSIVTACADLMGGRCFNRLEDGVIRIGVSWNPSGSRPSGPQGTNPGDCERNSEGFR